MFRQKMELSSMEELFDTKYIIYVYMKWDRKSIKLIYKGDIIYTERLFLNHKGDGWNRTITATFVSLLFLRLFLQTI